MDIKRTDLLDKIKKLLNLADRSNGSTEAEALNALTRAKALMTQHNIEMSDLEVKNIKNEPTDTIEAAVRRGFYSWDTRLFFICDNLFGTSHFRSRSSAFKNGSYVKRETMKFFGLKVDAEIATAVYPVLFKMCQDRSRMYSSTAQKNAYLDGFTHRLLERSKEFQHSQTTSLTKQAQEAKCSAIVVVKKDVLTTMYTKLGLVQSRTKTTNKSYNPAYSHGYNDGAGVNLNFRNSLS